MPVFLRAWKEVQITLSSPQKASFKNEKEKLLTLVGPFQIHNINN